MRPAVVIPEFGEVQTRPQSVLGPAIGENKTKVQVALPANLTVARDALDLLLPYFAAEEPAHGMGNLSKAGKQARGAWRQSVRDDVGRILGMSEAETGSGNPDQEIARRIAALYHMLNRQLPKCPEFLKPKRT